jgi:hypothetical protein
MKTDTLVYAALAVLFLVYTVALLEFGPAPGLFALRQKLDRSQRGSCRSA